MISKLLTEFRRLIGINNYSKKHTRVRHCPGQILSYLKESVLKNSYLVPQKSILCMNKIYIFLNTVRLQQPEGLNGIPVAWGPIYVCLAHISLAIPTIPTHGKTLYWLFACLFFYMCFFYQLYQKTTHLYFALFIELFPGYILTRQLFGKVDVCTIICT
jgi:hypothetical protein